MWRGWWRRRPARPNRLSTAPLTRGPSTARRRRTRPPSPSAALRKVVLPAARTPSARGPARKRPAGKPASQLRRLSANESDRELGPATCRSDCGIALGRLGNLPDPLLAPGDLLRPEVGDHRCEPVDLRPHHRLLVLVLEEEETGKSLGTGPVGMHRRLDEEREHHHGERRADLVAVSHVAQPIAGPMNR